MKISELRILFVQRVITTYRLDLFKEFCTSYKHVGIISSNGTQTGTLKIATKSNHQEDCKNLTIHILPSFKINYKGETRSTTIFLYPKAIKFIKKYDIIVFEGTTNIINNSFLIPYAKIQGKKLIFWDAGYSLNKRSLKRKIIDSLNLPLVRLTDLQMAYSKLAGNYMREKMGAKNVFVNLNTINTRYFEKIKKEITDSIDAYSFNKSNIKLLYVGVIEERKKVKELIDIVLLLNKKGKRFSINIIGGGNQLSELKEYAKSINEISFTGPIYDKEELKSYYFKSDLFVLPGDGGLAIVQSHLFGLPVVCTKGADGTELDYITYKPFLLDNLSDLYLLLDKLKSIKRSEIYKDLPDISSGKWIQAFNNKIKELY
jgi:glycosyltransferase involved in cell wall biosynthesis